MEEHSTGTYRKKKKRLGTNSLYWNLNAIFGSHLKNSTSCSTKTHWPLAQHWRACQPESCQPNKIVTSSHQALTQMQK